MRVRSSAYQKKLYQKIQGQLMTGLYVGLSPPKIKPPWKTESQDIPKIHGKVLVCSNVIKRREFTRQHRGRELESTGIRNQQA